MKTAPFDILKRTPRTNCGQCGFAGCLAFAADVAAAGGDPGRCPYIDKTGLEVIARRTSLEDAGRLRDLALAAQLKDKISSRDFVRIAPFLGADLIEETLIFSFLGREVRLNSKNLTLDGSEPEDPRDMILLYNYVASSGGAKPTADWIGLESLPNSISKVKTLSTYCEAPLARLFSEFGTSAMTRACLEIGGIATAAAGCSAGFLIPALPCVPILLLFWAEDLEDGFPARVKALFDRHVLDFLDLESLVFTAERLAERLQVLVAN